MGGMEGRADAAGGAGGAVKAAGAPPAAVGIVGAGPSRRPGRERSGQRADPEPGGGGGEDLGPPPAAGQALVNLPGAPTSRPGVAIIQRRGVGLVRWSGARS